MNVFKLPRLHGTFDLTVYIFHRSFVVCTSLLVTWLKWLSLIVNNLLPAPLPFSSLFQNQNNMGASSSKHSHTQIKNSQRTPSVNSFRLRAHQLIRTRRLSHDTDTSKTSDTQTSSNPDIKPNKVNFKWMNDGRMHHDVEGSSYILASDDLEMDRLSMQHFIIRTCFGGNVLAPVSNILENDGKVLDLGTANGAWAMDFASEFPNSEVIGIDMVPVFPSMIKPENCTFMLANIINPGLPFEDDTFDFVNMRMFFIAIKQSEWPIALKECLRVLKPGGWLECREMDLFAWRAGPKLSKLLQDAITSLTEIGQFEPLVARKLGTFVKTAGFTSVKAHIVSCPISTWGGQIGIMTKENGINSFMSAKPAMSAMWRMESSEYDELVRDSFNEADNSKAFWNYTSVIGMKPFKKDKADRSEEKKHGEKQKGGDALIAVT